MPDHRLTPTTSGGFQFEYFLKDYLGDIMITFTDANNDGTPEILTKDHYYPFGLTMPELSYQAAGISNKLKYNGKELQEDHGLDWYDYGNRFYDMQIGRWHVVDKKAELYWHVSPYVYALNTPINAIDPDGRIVIFINGNHYGDGGSASYWRQYNNIVVGYRTSNMRFGETIPVN